MGGDIEYRLIGADRGISGHVILLQACQKQAVITMACTNDWAVNMVGLIVKANQRKLLFRMATSCYCTQLLLP